VRRSTTKLKALQPGGSYSDALKRRSQKAAVTRASNRLKAAEQSGRLRLRPGAQQGVVRPGKRSGVMNPEVMPRGGRPPAAQRPGSMTSILRGTLQALAQADARRIREIEGITGMSVTVPRSAVQGGTPSGRRVQNAARIGSVSRTLGTALRDLAQSDARTIREMDAIIRDATPKLAGSDNSGRPKRVRGSGGQRRLPGGRKRKPKS